MVTLNFIVIDSQLTRRDSNFSPALSVVYLLIFNKFALKTRRRRAKLHQQRQEKKGARVKPLKYGVDAHQKTLVNLWSVNKFSSISQTVRYTLKEKNALIEIERKKNFINL